MYPQLLQLCLGELCFSLCVAIVIVVEQFFSVFWERVDSGKMAANTLDSIKKKMVAMKGDKDGALDKANQLEQKVAEQKGVNEKVSRLY